MFSFRSIYCRKLFDAALEMKSVYLRNLQIQNKIFLDQPSSSVSSRDSTSNDNLSSSIPNAHLSRTPAAIQAEILYKTEKAASIPRMKEEESIIVNQLKPILDKIIFMSSSIMTNRIVIIHSCLFANQSVRVLKKLIHKIESSAIIEDVSAVLIFHYGEPLPSTFVDSFPSTSRFLSKYSVFHVSAVSWFFEVPSLRIMSFVSQYFSSHSRDDTARKQEHQILYLHTKGVSYNFDYPQIEDWVDMMLYFLVQKHASCYHLLASMEFDLIGLNYCSSSSLHPTKRMLSGNFFWVSSSYVSKLSPLQYENSNKYDAEYWLFESSKKTRIYVPHISNVFHASQRYPSFCYTPSNISTLPEEIPSFKKFVEVCQDDNYEEFQYLHINSLSEKNRQMALQNPYNQGSNNDRTSKRSLSARCTALDLYSL
jgi:hypothetical protein